ncbi:MAG TPA: carbohydrate kinase family protein [Pseudonocardia sp.]
MSELASESSTQSELARDPSPTPLARAGVVCAGSVVVDVGKVIEAYPPLDHITTIEAVTQSTGGPGLNLAVNLRQLGARFPLTMLGAVGADQHGAFVLAECARLHIDTTGVATLPGVATSFTDAMVERVGGRRTFFHHVGANGLFDGDAAAVETSTARILHVGAPGLHPLMDAPTAEGDNGWSRLLRRARAAGLRTNLELVSLAPERLREVALRLLPDLDTIVVNELEAGALTGIDAPVPDADGPVDWSAIAAMAAGLVERGVARLAVVHFPAGSVAAAPDGSVWWQGSVRLPPDRVRSTTGAGDAFASGVLLGLHEDRPVQECLRLGAAVAAACVQGLNTSDSIGPAEACLADAERVGYRAAPAVRSP